MIKRFSVIFMVSLIFILSGLAANADDSINVKMDGKLLRFDVPPASVEGRTLVPLRAIFEELGMDIKWDGKTQTVEGTRGKLKITLQVNNKKARAGDRDVELDVPGKIIEGRTLVPIRFVAESTGAKVFWDGAEKTVYISTSSDETLTIESIKASLEYARQGSELCSGGKFDEALQILDKAIEVSPKLKEAYFAKGKAYYGTGKYQEALTAFDKASELDPADPNIYYEKSIVLEKLGKYKDALNAIDKALESNPGEAGLYYKKASILKLSGKAEEAVTACDQALELNPGYKEVYYLKACIYSIRKDPKNALENLKKAFELDSTLKDTANADKDLDNVRNTEGFKALINQK